MYVSQGLASEALLCTVFASFFFLPVLMSYLHSCQPASKQNFRVCLLTSTQSRSGPPVFTEYPQQLCAQGSLLDKTDMIFCVTAQGVRLLPAGHKTGTCHCLRRQRVP